MTAPPTYFAAALDQIKEDLQRRGKEIFDFGVGDPVEPTPDFVRRALIDALDPVSQYPSVIGQRRLREAVAGWASRRLDVTLDPETQVIPAAASSTPARAIPCTRARPSSVAASRTHTCCPRPTPTGLTSPRCLPTSW